MADHDKIDSVIETGAPKKLRSLRTVFTFILPYRGLVAGALTALVIAAGATLAIFQSLQLIVDNGFAAEDTANINQYFLGLLAVILVMSIAVYLRFTLVTILGERVVADIRKAVLSRLIGLHPSFFEENRPGEIASRLTADTTLIQTVVGQSLSIALRNILTLTGGVVMLFLLSPKLMGLIALVVPVIVTPLVFIGRRLRSLAQESQARIAHVGTMAHEALDAIQTVQAFTREDAERSRFGKTVEAAFDIARQRIRVRGALTVLIIFLSFAAIDLVLWQGAKDVISGAMTGGELAAFVGLSVLVASGTGALAEVFGELMRGAGAAARISELLAVTSNLKVPARPVEPPVPAEGRVAFENVTFQYPSRPGTNALEDFTLEINPGETVALVGPSGAGKSTVLQLLLRFFDPQEGHITVDGVDIRQMSFQGFRSRLAVVPQDTTIFADTVAANIHYGRQGATEEELWQAIRAAECEDFINALPAGVETHLGEKGIRLSGGQRQRIAVARAILRDAPILLLDEATSALDSESERKVQRALEHSMVGRTTIVIAHRLSTVTAADRLVVINEGRITSIGSHNELMAKDPLYRKLASLQFETQLAG